jgi:hypothetical protein
VVLGALGVTACGGGGERAEDRYGVDNRDVRRPSLESAGPAEAGALRRDEVVYGRPQEPPDMGDCIAVTDVVDCREPHDFQVTAVGDHPAAPEAAVPSPEEWLRYRAERCEPAAREFLGHPVGPARRAFPTIAAPPADAWADGDRSVVCGVAWDEDGDGTAAPYRGDLRDLVAV